MPDYPKTYLAYEMRNQAECHTMQTLRRHNWVVPRPRFQILFVRQMRRGRRTRLSSPMLYHFGGRWFHRALGVWAYPCRQRRLKMTNPNSTVQSPCQVCSTSVLVDPYGNGFCENCGWVQNREYDKYPDDVCYLNFDYHTLLQHQKYISFSVLFVLLANFLLKSKHYFLHSCKKHVT